MKIRRLNNQTYTNAEIQSKINKLNELKERAQERRKVINAEILSYKHQIIYWEKLDTSQTKLFDIKDLEVDAIELKMKKGSLIEINHKKAM